MAGTVNLVTQLTILNGQTSSGQLSLILNTDRELIAVTILSPTTLPETVNVQVSTAIGGTYRTLQSDGVDIVLPANKATTITHLVAGSLKLLAGAAVGGDRAFDVCMRFTNRWLSG